MYRNKYIMLNLNLVNGLFEQSIANGMHKKYESLGTCFMEANVEGYKADLFFKEEKLIMENKAIISTTKETLFPTVFSRRAILQLKKLNTLLSLGYKVRYNIILLSPFVRVIELNEAQKEFYKNFNECIENNMEVGYYSMIFEKGQVICKEIKIRSI
jgi:DNA-binding sugar fermentation-stimulating protein